MNAGNVSARIGMTSCNDLLAVVRRMARDGAVEAVIGSSSSACDHAVVTARMTRAWQCLKHLAEFRLRKASIHFAYSQGYGESRDDAYERVILDALIGDATLFIRADEVARSWRIRRGHRHERGVSAVWPSVRRHRPAPAHLRMPAAAWHGCARNGWPRRKAGPCP
jgi:hypothetical protein